MQPSSVNRPVDLPGPGLSTASGRRIIGVVSGKGGVGKTFVSVNLAAALADAGNRTLIFDADLGLANVDLQLGVDPRLTIADFLLGRNAIDELVVRVDNVGIDIIGGRSAAATLTSTSEQERRKLKSALVTLGRSYDYTLIDLAAGIDVNVSDFFEICDTILVVLRGDPSSLMDAYALVKIVPHEIRSRIAIVTNAVSSSRDGTDLANYFADVTSKYLRFRPEYLGGIRADRTVDLAIRRQMPVYAVAPQCHATADIRELARRVMA